MVPACVLLSLLLATAQASGSESFEWAGIFETPDPVYFWGAEKVEGKYADPGMKIVLLHASSADEKALHEREDAGINAIELPSCTVVNASGTLTPDATKCYQLMFDQNSHLTLFKVDTSAADHVAFFAEHVPTEFERNSHYLKDVKGEDIEPAAELPEEVIEKPWGEAIGASIIVNVVTIIGVIFLVPFFKKLKENPDTRDVMTICINAFAAGALLAAAFYLMLYEATHLIKPEGSTEAEMTAAWGSMILIGFLSPYFIDLFASFFIPPKASGKSAATEQTEDAEQTVAEKVKETDPGRQIRVLAGILLGDFMHNLVDGVFIGFGFMVCGAKGWTITGATVAHEIAQEVADYLVLTEEAQGNLKPWKALLLNVVSGTSVILGAIIILAKGADDNFSMGMLLAYGGGIYLQIGCAECMPRAAEKAESPVLRILGLCIFFFGAVTIGLVLIGHEHCSEDGGHAH